MNAHTVPMIASEGRSGGSRRRGPACGGLRREPSERGLFVNSSSLVSPGGVVALSCPTTTPIADIVREYIEHMDVVKTACSKRVDSWYLHDAFGMRCGCGPHLDIKYLEELTTAAVSRFIDAVVRLRKLAGKTGNRYREVLQRLVNWAMRQRGVVMPGNVNPVSAVERLRERKPAKRFLTLEDIPVQLEALRPWPLFHAAVATLIYAGLRRSELLWLTVADVDFLTGSYGVLRVRAKTVQGNFWEPKTGQERAVPVNSSLRPILEAYAATQKEDRTWFFPSPKGKRWDPDGFSHRLRDLNRRAGLVWSSLDFRHTFGSQLAMKGESLYKVSALMGNSPEICRRHYAALSSECLVATVEFPTRIGG